MRKLYKTLADTLLSCDKRTSREHRCFVSFETFAIVRSTIDDGNLVSVYLSYNSHKSLLSIMAVRDAQLHATFSHKFSSFPRRPQCDGIFQQRNINSLRSLCFCPSRAENLQGRYQWAVSFFLFTNFTRGERREISSLREERGTSGKKKERKPS